MSSFRALLAAEYLAAAETAEIVEAQEQAFDGSTLLVWDILRAVEKLSRNTTRKTGRRRPAKPKKKC